MPIITSSCCFLVRFIHHLNANAMHNICKAKKRHVDCDYNMYKFACIKAPKPAVCISFHHACSVSYLSTGCSSAHPDQERTVTRPLEFTQQSVWIHAGTVRETAFPSSMEFGWMLDLEAVRAVCDRIPPRFTISHGRLSTPVLLYWFASV